MTKSTPSAQPEESVRLSLFHVLWRWLTEPSAAIQAPEPRSQAYLLAVLLVGLIPLLMVSILSRIWIDGRSPVYVIIGLVLLLAAYGFGRSPYYRAGVYLVIAVFAVIPYSAVITSNYDPDRLIHALVWVVPPVLLAVLLLSWRSVLLLVMFNLGLILLLPLMTPTISYVHIVYPLAYLSIVIILLLTAANIRKKNLQQIEIQADNLLQSNQYLQNILESISAPFYVINVQDYTIELANKAARELGISSSSVTPTCYALTHRRETPCAGGEHPCPLATVRETRKPTMVEHVHFDKEGRQCIMEVYGYPILDEHGDVVLMIEHSIDITQRRKAEESVRKLSRAVEQSNSTIIITNLDGIIEYVNPACTKTTGYSIDEIIGQNARLFKSGKHSKEFYADLWDTLGRGEVWQGEMINRKKNGDLYWEFATMSPVKDTEGHITHYLSIKENITQQMETEENIRKLSRAVEQSGSSIVITTLDGDIEYVNPAFSETTGYSAAEALGENPRILKSDAQPAELYTELWQTISSGEVWQGELLNKKKNGDLYWEFATISPVKDDNGNVTHYLAIKDDITRRKQMEQELAQARDEALAASRLKTQLLANVSHDMRTPLGSILGYTEMLQEGVYGDITEEQKSATTTIIDSTGQLLLFINNLLDQSQIETGKVVLKQYPFDPARLLNVLESAAGARVEAKGLQLVREVSPDLPDTLIGDSYWLRQIITNLVSNAVKFTEQGSVKVSLYRRDKASWAIEVKDTGMGISKGDQEFIFEAFRQVDGTMVRAQGIGSGLGLSIVRELTTLMAGTIELVSEEGQGSTFTIVLPIIPV